MPDQSDTLLDKYMTLGTKTDPRRKHAPFPWQRFVQSSCHIMLEASLFAISSAMIALGLPLFFFLAISGWDLLGLFMHLDNLSTRYLEADASRRLSFSGDLKIMFFAATTLVAMLRMPSFISTISGSFAERQTQ